MKRLLTVLMIFACFTIKLLSEDSWSLTNGPAKGQSVGSLSILDNGSMVSVIQNGIYISTNKGNTWEIIEKDRIDYIRTFSLAASKSLVVIPGNYLIDGAEASFVYYSTDFGNSWQSRKLDTIIGYYDTTRAIIDKNGCIYYSAGSNMFKSTDTCRTWQRIHTPTDSAIRSLGVDSSNVLFAGFYTGLYYSTDQGVSWLNAIDGQPVYSIAVTQAGIRAAVTNSGLSYSPANPGAWSSLTNIIPGEINCIATLDNEILAATNFGVHSLDLTTLSWTALGFPEKYVLTVSPGAKNEMLISIRNKGMFLTSDKGLNWTEVNSGIFNCLTKVLLADNSRPIYAFTPENDLFLTTDKGENWSEITFQGDQAMSAVSNGDTLVVISNDGYTYYLPSPSGEWSQIMNMTYLDNLLQKDKAVYCSSWQAIFRLNTISSQWDHVLEFDFFINVGSIYLDNSGNFYVISKDTLLLKKFPPSGQPEVLFERAVKSFATGEDGTLFALKEGNNLLVSKNAGTDWESLVVPVKQTESAVKIYVYYDNILKKNIILLLYEWDPMLKKRAILRSDDEGKSWKPYTDGIRTSIITSLLYDKTGSLYAGTDLGVYRLDFASGVGDQSNGSGQDILAIIYPNPAADYIYIDNYSKPACPLFVSIVDVLGITVSSSVIDKGTPVINLGGIPAGVYFVIIAAGGREEIKKLVVSRQ